MQKLYRYSANGLLERWLSQTVSHVRGNIMLGQKYMHLKTKGKKYKNSPVGGRAPPWSAADSRAPPSSSSHSSSSSSSHPLTASAPQTLGFKYPLPPESCFSHLLKRWTQIWEGSPHNLPSTTPSPSSPFLPSPAWVLVARRRQSLLLHLLPPTPPSHNTPFSPYYILFLSITFLPFP